jgi:hypothetical protein
MLHNLIQNTAVNLSEDILEYQCHAVIVCLHISDMILKVSL